MIEVDGDILDAAVPRDALNYRAEDTLRLNVRGGQPFPLLQIRTLYLIRGNRAAP